MFYIHVFAYFIAWPFCTHVTKITGRMMWPSLPTDGARQACHLCYLYKPYSIFVKLKYTSHAHNIFSKFDNQPGWPRNETFMILKWFSKTMFVRSLIWSEMHINFIIKLDTVPTQSLIISKTGFSDESVMAHLLSNFLKKCFPSVTFISCQIIDQLRQCCVRCHESFNTFSNMFALWIDFY